MEIDGQKIRNLNQCVESIYLSVAYHSRKDYGEERIQALGQVDGTFYVVAYTWRGQIRHLITAWKIGEDGKRRYETIFARRNQADASTGVDEEDPG